MLALAVTLVPANSSAVSRRLSPRTSAVWPMTTSQSAKQVLRDSPSATVAAISGSRIATGIARGRGETRAGELSCWSRVSGLGRCELRPPARRCLA
jgi:hypothetical protein